MIIFFSIVLVIGAITGLIGVFYANEVNAYQSFPLILVYTGVISIVISTIGLVIHQQTPTAMDVYRGNTTLEILYVDGVPQDSTVIFKTKQ